MHISAKLVEPAYLEANPLARKVGWPGIIVLNIIIVGCFAQSPLATIALATTSYLVATRNFQSAWVMRSSGEQASLKTHTQQIRDVSARLYFVCLLGQTLPPFLIGIGLVTFNQKTLALQGLGLGLIGYAVAVTIHSSLDFWHLRKTNSR